MKRVGKSVFFIAALLIFAITFLSFFGVHTQYGDNKTTWIKGGSDIRWGIDIRGGVDVTFSPTEGYVASVEDMDAAMAIVELRLLSQNITDYEAYIDMNKQRIIVRFPWKEDEADFNPEQAIKELGETALLTFREGIETDSITGAPIGKTAETIILQGQDVTNASAAYTKDDYGRDIAVVALKLSSEGSGKFEEATGRLIGSTISIWMDETVISAPTVNSKISGGEAIITGMETIEAAKELADKINAGALPFKLVTDNYNTISPTLGAGAKDAMLLAGIIAFISIAILMISMYRLPGAVAVIALLGQVGLMIATVTGFFGGVPSFTLTLPGIAGIILSIGCGVDANVITAERIKEEMLSGKTIDGAINSGCKNSFSAIFDGNITVIIVAIILMGAFGPPNSFFGTLLHPFFFMFGPATAGTIYSFGYTLLMGVISNFIMGVFASRMMLKSISRFSAFRKNWMYGSEKTAGHMGFMANSKKFFTLSCTVIAVILVCVAIFSVNLDIQFKGGSIITYSYTGDLNTTTFESVAQNATSADASFQYSRNLATNSDMAVISLPGSLEAEQMSALTAALDEALPQNNLQTASISNVDPTIGSEFFKKCLTAVSLAFALMLIYITLRFRRIGGFSAGVMAIVALLHDITVAFGVFVIFQFPIDGNFIAVVLTILGYSLNDTIVIYDRIRENERLLGSKTPVGELVNISINQSFHRSLMTSVTTVMAMIVVAIVAYLYGVTSITTFAVPMVFGLICGNYSSICIAGPLWVKWQEHKLAKKQATA